MTDRARAVLQKMKPRRLFGNPRARDRILDEFNRSTLDDVGPVGGDQGMAILKDMNDLEVGHDEFVKSRAPGVDFL